MRGEGFDPQRLRAIRKGLRTLHTLELMAQTIYKFQITKKRNDVNRQLIAAMCNEMGHYQDFQIKLYEYGFRPSVIRWAFWLVGFAFGFGSRILGKKAVFKTGIWVESKAVHHYAELLEAIEQTRTVRSFWLFCMLAGLGLLVIESLLADRMVKHPSRANETSPASSHSENV